jgi:hypothetical protein
LSTLPPVGTTSSKVTSQQCGTLLLSASQRMEVLATVLLNERTASFSWCCNMQLHLAQASSSLLPL